MGRLTNSLMRLLLKIFLFNTNFVDPESIVRWWWRLFRDVCATKLLLLISREEIVEAGVSSASTCPLHRLSLVFLLLVGFWGTENEYSFSFVYVLVLAKLLQSRLKWRSFSPKKQIGRCGFVVLSFFDAMSSSNISLIIENASCFANDVLLDCFLIRLELPIFIRCCTKSVSPIIISFTKIWLNSFKNSVAFKYFCDR